MIRRGAILLAMAACLVPAAAGGQAIVTSPTPDSVDVTVYRAPGRAPETAMELQWLEGFALISETRQISLPAGESEIRFEGVAGGILPQSAIVTGFPQGIVERNRDAFLLSPGTLLDRSLGRRVHLRRTSLATGAVREHEAVVRSGADGAVVLESAEGFEALRCTGLPETIVYDAVPPGLSARPTLSVRARSAEPVAAMVTLSYLASGFDWQADYVATLSDDGERLALFAWLTLANGDETSFAGADAQAVAGQLNRTAVRVPPSEARPLSLHCWPQGTTSDIPRQEPPQRARLGRVAGFGEDIVVTGTRLDSADMAASVAMAVIQEEIGDLKLYRIPEPVTVAARSQKQVALLQRPEVQIRTVYRQRLAMVDSSSSAEAQRVLVARNRTDEGLGLPLPAGRLMLFSSDEARPILLGQAVVRDHAVGEDVEIELGPVPGVWTDLRLVGREARDRTYELVVTNDRPHAVRFEGEIESGGARVRSATRLGRRNGRPLWAVTVPANGTASLRYRVPR
jgi:hypothetical protein